MSRSAAVTTCECEMMFQNFDRALMEIGEKWDIGALPFCLGLGRGSFLEENGCFM